MNTPLSLSTILVVSVITSCSEPNRIEKESSSSASEVEYKSNPIEIKRSEDDRPDQAEYQEIVVRLENPRRSKSMTDSVYLTDEKTGKRYKVLFFREILGVRSSNEQQYVLKLYSDNALYGIDPIYSPVIHPDHHRSSSTKQQ